MLSILTPYPERSPTRAALIAHVLNEKLVPINRVQVYKLLQSNPAGNLIKKEWNECGRPRILPDQVIDQIKENLIGCSGKTITKDEIRKKIQIVISQGRVPLIEKDMEPSNTILRNYAAVLVSTDKGTITMTSIPKTNSRCT